MKPGNIEEVKARRKRSAVMGVVFFALIQLACALAFGAMCFIPDIPGWLFALFLVLALFCLGLIVPAVLLLKDRFEEIEGGELDAAAEYCLHPREGI